VVAHRGRHRTRKADAVHRQRTAGRQLVSIGNPHDQRAAAAHLFMQQADRIVLMVVGAEGIRADELGKTSGQVRLCQFVRPHFVQHDARAGLGGLPCGL